jgi:hypothetical protein
VDFNKLTPGEKTVVIAGGLLLVDLLFLPWYDFIRLTRTGIQTPNSFWGVMALVVTAAMVALVIATRLTSARVPDLPVPPGQAVFLGGIAVAALLFLKIAVQTSDLAIGAWLGLVLGGVTAYGGSLVRKESEGASPPAGPPGL